MNLKNDLILRAARGEFVDRVPVWLMRQAGRILPEYRKVRESAGNFLSLVQNPEMAAEVTIQPIDILDVDAAIIFSDILVVPEALGLPYNMIEKIGPIFPNTIKISNDVHKLDIGDISDKLFYVFEAIRIAKKNLYNRVPLIGFCGAPFTIFCYMVEGRGSKTFSIAKKMLYSNPILSHSLLQKITDCSILYLKEQVKSGVDMIQIFDSWAGCLSGELYNAFSLPYIKQICDELSNYTLITLFAKGAYFANNEFNLLNCNTIGLDWNMNIKESRHILNTKTLQGNLDPCVLYASFSDIKAQTNSMLEKFGKQKYIANLGHGVYPDTDVEKVKCFIDTVKSF